MRHIHTLYKSHPTRDVWVEIFVKMFHFVLLSVTSHTGCVSRNGKPVPHLGIFKVTSHTGCVSRNIYGCSHGSCYLGSHPTRDVWVEICNFSISSLVFLSHPTRDVWVEMQRIPEYVTLGRVTSHTGCVSRNRTSGAGVANYSVTSHTGCVSRNF